MNPTHNIDVSIVIPVLADAPALSTLLETLRRATDAPLEIIVVDGAADTDIAALCRRFACRYLHSRAGRGHQLHTGAMQAAGDIIWFLHADAEPPPDGIESIRRAVRAGAVGGCFRFRFSGPPGRRKSLIASLINVRCRFGIPYGDQGLFIRRNTYRDTGGFADTAVFEEVPLVRATRAAGRFVYLETTIGVSPRRWERDGWLRRTIENRLLACGYMIGLSPTTLARYYGAATHKGQPEC